MATKAFQKIYTKISQITKATCSLKATEVGYDELAMVNGKLAQVVKIAGDEVTLQVFEGTEGIPTNAEVVFLGKSPTLKVSEQLAGRFFNAFGDPIDGGPEIEGVEVEIGGPSVNPVRRKQPSELIATGIAGIDLNNTLVSGQKIPFFADPDQPFNQVMANVALRAETDKIILGGMGMTNDDYLYFKNVFSNAGALDRIISFVNTTENPPVERLLIPDMALTAAEYFAVEHNQKVLVLLTDMTSYADALAIVSNRMDQIPSKDSMPGSLYSDLAKIYEKAVQFPSGGSITIIAVTTLSGGDITHAVPDNTGYITEGQLFLRRDSDIGKVIVDPFRSLSRLKQLVSGKKTRKDHPQVMNAAVRLYADAANAKTKMENGFDLTNYDERALAFAKDYANQLLAIDVNLNTTEMLDVTWGLFSKYFKPEEVNIKKEFVDQYWRSNLLIHREMAIKFQYNKTSLQQLEKQLKIRVRTLPIIKNKESALRLEVKRCKTEAVELEGSLEKQIQAYEAMFALWNEFDASLIKVKDVHLGVRKIAGVRVPLLEDVDFDVRPFSLFCSPKWYADGIHLLKNLARTAIEREFTLAKLSLLEHARKKTTQKVNLFEKVQIPGYQDALRKIKRFMEDEENLSKSSQKILKSIQEKRKEAEV